MNSLSWLLYWADVLPALSRWMCAVCFLLFAAFSIILFLGVTDFFGDATEKVTRYDAKAGDYVETEFLKNPKFAAIATRFRKIGLLAPVFFLLWGASFMVPEKETFYLIAGSEAGERAIQTPEFDKVRKVINKYLDDNLDTGEKAVNDSAEEKK